MIQKLRIATSKPFREFRRPEETGTGTLRKPMAKTSSSVVGVDLGNYSIKAVRLQKRGAKCVLVRAAMVPTHRDPSSTGVPTEHELAALIRNVVSLVGVSGADVHFTVNSQNSTLRYVDLPGIPLDEIRSVLKLNSANYLRQNFEGYTFDACPLDAAADAAFAAKPHSPKAAAASSSAGKIKALVGGISNTEVVLYYHAARRAGIRPKSLQLAPISLCNGFEAAKPQVFLGEALALLDLGLLSASLTILERGKPLLTRAVSVGGKNITEALRQTLGMDFEKAEAAKLQGHERLGPAVSQTCANLIREVCSSVNFFEKNTENLVSRIYVAGASAKSPSILEVLSRDTGKACETWSAAEGLEVELPAEQREAFLQNEMSFCAALGVARSYVTVTPISAPPVVKTATAH